MNNHSSIIPNQILVGEQLYSEAINIILSSAQRELLIFDQNFMHGDFASKEKFYLFQQFLNKSLTKKIANHASIPLIAFPVENKQEQIKKQAEVGQETAF